MLHAALASVRLALVTFVLLPTALVGGLLAALATAYCRSNRWPVLTVFGIAARNRILMASRFEHLERHEVEAFGPELMLRSTREAAGPT